MKINVKKEYNFILRTQLLKLHTSSDYEFYAPINPNLIRHVGSDESHKKLKQMNSNS